MKNISLKMAIFGALGLLSAQAFSLGLETLPVAGFPVTGTGAGTHQPTGGTTPHKICNPTGNFGSSTFTTPTAAANNTCAIVPAPSTVLTSPVTGFTLVTSANRTITMNNARTNNTNVNIGTLQDVVFRNAAATECIYATQVSLTSTDYNLTLAGVQNYEMNGLARGGFAASGTVSAGYAMILGNADTVYRIGRTFTSVQHRAASASSPTFAPGYYNLPLTPGSVASVNGVNANTLSVPTAAQQTANVDANWVEFATDVNFNDPDGGTKPGSSALYVRAGCSSAAPVAVANAIRLRMTYQEPSSPQEFIEVRVTGFVPPSGNANPAPVAGSLF
jgi:hypothetical protein